MMNIMPPLEDYVEVVGDAVIAQIYEKARKLYGKDIVHINSTYHGGGVAEILSSLVPLMNYIGIDAGWRIIPGKPRFFQITKKIHNCLQGDENGLTEEEKAYYLETNETFSLYTHLEDEYDCVIVHDPQPMPLIRFYRKRQPWVWRCHIDLSAPNPSVWQYIRQFVLRYDAVIISSEKYRARDLPVRHDVIPPAIDPLTPKNRPLSDQEIDRIFKEFDIPTDKPIIAQVSRFDKWKDPQGVVEIFRKVKQRVDCRLVLLGSMASDDPEGWAVYEGVKDAAQDLVDAGDAFLITAENDLLVNALQTRASVIIQKSIKEGFGLTVTEALWKGRPLVASNVGGIPLQVKDGESGFLLEPFDHEGFVEKVVWCLRNQEKAEEMGKRGKEVVRSKFLITRVLKDYLELLNALMIE